MINTILWVFDAVSARTRNKSVSLHWGSHLAEHQISPFISEFVVEKSDDRIIIVNDPVNEGYSHRHAFNDRMICKLKNATFDPQTGSIYLGDLLVRESHSDSPSLSVRKHAKRCSSCESPLIGVDCQTYYHWIIEILPRVITASLYEPNAILVAPTQMSINQRQALEILGNRIHYSDLRHTCDELVVATRALDSGWAHPSDLEVLRRTYNVPNEGGFRQIFVSRIGSRRSDEFSQVIEEFAISQGWTVVRAEELTWHESLKIFGEASIIAGEHGAGLANIALAPKGTQLIEIERKNYANPCYAALSFALNGDSSNFKHYPLEQFQVALTLQG
jgi:hypothetical protein